MPFLLLIQVFAHRHISRERKISWRGSFLFYLRIYSTTTLFLVEGCEAALAYAGRLNIAIAAEAGVQLSHHLFVSVHHHRQKRNTLRGISFASGEERLKENVTLIGWNVNVTNDTNYKYNQSQH